MQFGLEEKMKTFTIRGMRKKERVSEEGREGEREGGGGR